MKSLKINALLLLLAGFAVHASENQALFEAQKRSALVHGTAYTAGGLGLLTHAYRLKNPTEMTSSWKMNINNLLARPAIFAGIPMTMLGTTLLFKWYNSNVRPYYAWQSPIKKVQSPVILQSPVRKR